MKASCDWPKLCARTMSQIACSLHAMSGARWGKQYPLLLNAVSSSYLTPITLRTDTRAGVNTITLHRYSSLTFVGHSMARIKHGPNVYKKRDPECVCFALRPAKKVEPPTSGLIAALADGTASEGGKESVEVGKLIVISHSSTASPASPSHPSSRVDEVVQGKFYDSAAPVVTIDKDQGNPYDHCIGIVPDTRMGRDARVEAMMGAIPDENQQAQAENIGSQDFMEGNALIAQQLRHTQAGHKDLSSSSCLSDPDAPLMPGPQRSVMCDRIAATDPHETSTKLPNLSSKQARAMQIERARQRRTGGSYKKPTRRSRRSAYKFASEAAQQTQNTELGHTQESNRRGRKRSVADVIVCSSGDRQRKSRQRLKS